MSLNEILFVSRESPDDEVRRSLKARGFSLTAKADFDLDLQRLASKLAAIVVDLRAGDEAINFITRIRENETTKVLPVLVVGEWGSGLAAMALSRGADAYEPTPLTAQRLESSIQRLLAKQAVAAGVNN
ncbi:MAG TPA: hypothetical protein VGJ69_13530 [Pyrinomonadaceae bacterium]